MYMSLTEEPRKENSSKTKDAKRRTGQERKEKTCNGKKEKWRGLSQNDTVTITLTH